MESNRPLISIREAGLVHVTAETGRVAIRLDRDAEAEFLVLQDDSSGAEETAYDIALAAGSSLELVFLTLGDGKTVNRIRVSLDGERAACALAGLCLAGGRQQTSFDIVLTHRVPGCRSDQLFKSILGGESVFRFDGLIKVVPDAQKTEAYQANHNLLVSDAAKAFTLPQLEIYADDVKCSHGATVGRLNPDELFYMRTRGISLAEAQLLQQMAFSGEVLEKISSVEARERMRELVENRLRNGL